MAARHSRKINSGSRGVVSSVGAGFISLDGQIHTPRSLVIPAMELIQILQGVATVLVALLAGSMLFFSFVMAPLIFIKLDIDVAGKFVRAVFPWYYLLILILAALGALTLVAFAPLNAGLMALIAASTAYCRQYLMPRINEYRDRSRAGEAGTTEIFDKLHRRSEVLNGLQLLAVMAVLLHLAFVQFS